MWAPLVRNRFILILPPALFMNESKRKAALLLLAMFAAILLSAVFQANDLQIAETEEITVIHKHEYSDETLGNVVRSFVVHIGFENRTLQDFTFHTLEVFHSQMSRTTYIQLNLRLVQFNAPVKVYKRIQEFLI